jgi:hypothetical protein
LEFTELLGPVEELEDNMADDYDFDLQEEEEEEDIPLSEDDDLIVSRITTRRRSNHIDRSFENSQGYLRRHLSRLYGCIITLK